MGDFPLAQARKAARAIKVQVDEGANPDDGATDRRRRQNLKSTGGVQ
jgi:hypothetical protein